MQNKEAEKEVGRPYLETRQCKENGEDKLPVTDATRKAASMIYWDAIDVCIKTEQSFDHGTCKLDGAMACIEALKKRASEI